MSTLLHNAPELLLLLFLVITFLQSGIDKIFDWRGNLGWLKGHFSDTPLRGMVPLLLSIVLLFEIVSALLCAVGLYEVALTQGRSFALYGAILSCISLLMLLFGQRLAKDYEGAKTIAVYFIPAIFLVYLLTS